MGTREILDRETLPLTPNNKVARQALPVADLTRSEVREFFIAPRDALEYQLVQMWESIMGICPIGVTDSFFCDLGGHSLLATQVIACVRDTFQMGVDLGYFFETPTIAGLADIIRQNIT